MVTKDLPISPRFTFAMQVQNFYNSSTNGLILLTHDYHGGPPESEEQQRTLTEVDCHGGPVSEMSGPPEATASLAGSLYRHATSDGCNHQAGPSPRQPPLSRTRPVKSGFTQTRWRCRCSPYWRGSGSSHRRVRQYPQRRDRSSRR